MTKEEFDIITNKIGCWFTHLKLNSFRKTFDGEVYPSSALGTDYDLFIHKLEKELLFEDNHSVPSDLDEAAEKASKPEPSGWLDRELIPKVKCLPVRLLRMLKHLVSKNCSKMLSRKTQK